MPLGPGVRYRMKDGVRLAFKGRRVVETKKMSTGDTHMKITSKLPSGASLSPKGDLCKQRMAELGKVFGEGIKRTKGGKMPSDCLPTKGMQLPK